MRRSVSLVVSLLALAFPIAGPATADFAEIKGSGDIQRLFVNNMDTKVIGKIYAPGGSVNSVELRLRGTDGQIYRAVILNSPTGDKALYKGQANDVNCPNLSITYNSTSHFWRFAVPRGCLNALTNKIRAKGYWADAGAPGYSETVWTPGIRRG